MGGSRRRALAVVVRLLVRRREGVFCFLVDAGKARGVGVIAALFVQEGGCYYGLDDVDPWPESRDARLYRGTNPVVAHPPCARWCRLAGLVEARYGHRKGDDGGCFASALENVRRCGGVLEHPAYSDAWVAFRLPEPSRGGGWQRGLCGGWSCHVEQGNYGHKARKATWLYSYGVATHRLRWGKSADSTAAVSLGFKDSWSRRLRGEVQQMSKRQCSATPIEFRDLLLEMARSVSK